MKVILIADSGSTKTDWCAVNEEGKVIASCKTQGINPFHQSGEMIHSILREELLPGMDILWENHDMEIFFYGSGVTEEKKTVMTAYLQSVFPHVAICCESDLLGAARASLGHQPGIACILGTGANSCLYDGEQIVMNTPPLGYILGDEGSGAYLGKQFLNAIFKNDSWKKLKEEYLAWSGLTYPDIINRVYREPLANRFLASVAPFISQVLSREPVSAGEAEVTAELEKMVTDAFRLFLEKNLLRYLDHIRLQSSPAFGDDITVGFVGSIAHYFEKQLRAAFGTITVANVQKSPMAGLILFHKGKYRYHKSGCKQASNQQKKHDR